MSDDTYGYSEAIQKKIVAMMVFDSASYIENSEIVLPEFFDNPVLQNLVSIIKDFFERYSNTPTSSEFFQEARSFVDARPKLSRNDYADVIGEILTIGQTETFEYVKDKAVEFAKYQGVRAALLESAEALQKSQDYAKINQSVNDALLIGESHADMGTDYRADLEDRLVRRRTGGDRAANVIHTGIVEIDQRLLGGIGEGEMGIIMGPAKRGKSINAVCFGKGALWQGKNVAHYIMEGSEERTQAMYDASISGVPREELKDNEDLVRGKVNNFFSSPHSGRLWVTHYPPQGCSARTIEAHLQRLRILEKYEANLIIIDYLGLMKASDRQIKFSGDASGRSVMFGTMTKELMSLCQRYKYSAWVLHQSNLKSFKKLKVDMSDTAASAEPVRDADIIITVNQTEEEANMVPMQVRLYIAGGREMPDKKMVCLTVDKSAVRVEPLGGDLSI